MSLHSTYVDEISENLNYNATWLPTTVLAVGDVCRLTDGELRRTGSLTDFGIQFAAGRSDVESDMLYASAGATSIRIKAAGDPPPLGSALTIEEAGVSINFSRSNAVMLQLNDCTSHTITDLHAVGKQVLKQWYDDKWPADYVVIAEVVTAGASTIAISNEAGASLDCTVKGGAAAGPVTLAKVNAALEIKHQDKVGMRIVSAKGLTPLVKTSGIRKRLIWPDEFRMTGTAESAEFTNVDYTRLPPAAG